MCCELVFRVAQARVLDLMNCFDEWEDGKTEVEDSKTDVEDYNQFHG